MRDGLPVQHAQHQQPPHPEPQAHHDRVQEDVPSILGGRDGPDAPSRGGEGEDVLR